MEHVEAMKLNLPKALVCGLLMIPANLACVASVRGAEGDARAPVRVEVAGGRIFTAQIDDRTDAELLWLRSRWGSVGVLRPIRWDLVVGAQRAGRDLSAEELRREALAARRENPFQQEGGQGVRRIVVPGARQPARNTRSGEIPAPPL